MTVTELHDKLTGLIINGKENCRVIISETQLTLEGPHWLTTKCITLLVEDDVETELHTFKPVD